MSQLSGYQQSSARKQYYVDIAEHSSQFHSILRHRSNALPAVIHLIRAVRIIGTIISK